MILVSFLITGSTEPVKASYKWAAGEGRGGDCPRWRGLATVIGRATVGSTDQLLVTRTDL